MPDPISKPTHRENYITWIADTIRNRGLFGALRHYSAALVEFLRDLTPERRKSRYGDIDYDFDHGTDTTWATVPLRTRIRELLSGAQYQASEPELFHEILHALPVSPEGFTFIDLGSGKGRTLLMASDYPFARIVGVELLPELNQIAQKNITTYQSEQQKCFRLDSFPGDARDFEFPAKRTLLYLFNPFPEYVLRSVLQNLRTSIIARPREVYVIYHNVIHEAAFSEQSSWLRQVHRTHQFAIYRAETSQRHDFSPLPVLTD
jgi:SAM-dependent methyltransferase